MKYKFCKYQNKITFALMMRYLYAFLISFLLTCDPTSAQTRAQDSSALVNFYNKTSGDTWTNKTGWKTGSINTWFGINLKTNLVWNIILPSNGLKGNLGLSDLPNHPLGKIDLRGNKLTSFPSGGLSIDTLFLAGNRLTFSHLIPYAGMGNRLKYTGQDSIEQNMTVFGQQRNQVTLSVNTDRSVSGMVFKWYKNGVEIPGAASPDLILKCLTSANAGKYTCKLTHTLLPDLSIFRKTIFLIINPDVPNAGPDDNVCQSTYVLRAVAPVTGTGTWSVIKSNGTINNSMNPNSNISGMTSGANTLRWTITHSTCPVEFDDVTIIKDTVGELPFAGPDAVFCDSFFNLNATALKYGKGSWELVSGDLVFGQATNPQSKLVSIDPGDHILRWKANNGACPAFFDELKLTRVLPLGKVYAGRDTALCATDLHLNAQTTLNVKGKWRMISGSGKMIDSSKEYTYIYNLGEGNNKFEWTGWNACSNLVKDTVNIKVRNFINVSPGPDTSMYYTPTSPLAISRKSPASGGTGNFHYEWSPDNYLEDPNSAEGNFNPPDLGIYPFKLVATDDMGCKDSAMRTIEVNKVEKIDAPTLFTPNGDGVNDWLILPGIESYPNNELVIMDKLGQVVYRKKTYNNQWDGTAAEGSYSGTILPEDTYFYVIDLGEGKSKVQKGFIVIKK